MIPIANCDNGSRFRARKAVVHGPEGSNHPMIDNFHESTQRHASPEGVNRLCAEGPNGDAAVHASFAAKLRMIILLSLMSWAVLISGIFWLVT